MTGGVIDDGDGMIRIDIVAVRTYHDVNEHDDNCRTCGVEYLCELIEIVERLDEWLHPRGAARGKRGPLYIAVTAAQTAGVSQR